ncbi:hypothetical protein [Homoserinibacter sp. YIM 151385]|uniref:hypothetical protein n=1 Tax=Homoserinibacter sp. YIM 151385 TaxID=2985506 RepID=UPI0022F0ED21|nr:hypothetical protein [Homoserinibacter sp. YIM 151385]WBU38083.1 hypothetical protein OF852_00435 [Homoserinibacter sp. YIM 151385]
MPPGERALALSAQRIDPLSWFTGPNLPLVLTGVVFSWGLAAGLLTTSGTRLVWQAAALVLMTSATLFVQFMTRPQQRAFDGVMGAAALATASLGFVLSAIGYAGQEGFQVQLWWAPFGVALTLGALGPYLSTREIVLLGGATTLVTVPICWAIVADTVTDWGPIATVVIIAFPLLAGICVTGVFSHHVVGRMRVLLERRSQLVVSTDVVRDDEAERLERIRLAQLTARAVPFLEELIERGEIQDADRALAGQLARRVRDDLVAQANRSWLETIAAETHIAVIDPDGRADRMRASQRTALRGLVRAILGTPGIDPTSLLVELRTRPDGSTAVGVSLDVELPEGRRIMHLAPYLLTLRTTADGLVWDDEQFLRVSFEFPSGPSA